VPFFAFYDLCVWCCGKKIISNLNKRWYKKALRIIFSCKKVKKFKKKGIGMDIADKSVSDS